MNVGLSRFLIQVGFLIKLLSQEMLVEKSSLSTLIHQMAPFVNIDSVHGWYS